MRPDMPKRFLRHGKHSKGPFPRHCKNLSMKDEDGQNVHNPHGMRAAHHYTIKYEDRGYFGTDFAVLRRFLHSRKGRPWNEVFSEICAEADDRSFEGHHLREYLDYEVEQNCFIGQDGKIYDKQGNSVVDFWGEFYVHPETGILEYAEKKRYRQQDPVHSVFKMDGKLYHEHKDIWYRVEMEEFPIKDGYLHDVYWPSDLHDVFISEELGFAIYRYRVASQLRDKYGLSPKKKCWYCVKKQSANSHEISKLKKKYDLESAA